MVAEAVFSFVLLLSRQLKLTASDEYSKAIITKNVSLIFINSRSIYRTDKESKSKQVGL